MEIKAPLEIDYENDTLDHIVSKIEFAIEQHESFLKVISKKDLQEQEALNSQREW